MKAIQLPTSIHLPKQIHTPVFLKSGLSLVVLAIVACIAFFPIKISESASPALVSDNNREITLLFTGDIMQHMPQIECAWDEKSGVYSFDTCFSYIKPILSNAGICVANLETTLAGKPYSGYPLFSAPDALAMAMQNAGVDIAGTANNHCCDRGRTGIERTITTLDSLSIKHMGTYKSEDVYKNSVPLIINQNGFKLAFLNYTYGINGNLIPEGNVVSLIDKERITRDMQAARDSMPDKIIVFIHWGEEYQRLPNAFQKETADLLLKQGADIIIGSHPHVIQPMEWHKKDSVGKDKVVVWSLGNYISNQRKRYTDGGAMAAITLRKWGKHTHIENAGYYLTWVYNPVINGRKQYYILPAAQFENDSLLLNTDGQKDIKGFISDSREWLGKHNIRFSEIK